MYSASNQNLSSFTRNALFGVSWGLYVLLLIIFAALWAFDTSNGLSLLRFAQVTNIFFIWPALRAASLGAFSESFIFYVTFVVSVLHHGCTGNHSHREIIAPGSFILLAIGSSVVICGSALIVSRRLQSLGGGNVNDSTWSMRSDTVIASAVITSLFVILLFVFGFAVPAASIGPPSALDTCLLFHTPGDPTYTNVSVAHLVGIWNTADFLTAFAALIIVSVYFIQTRYRLELGLFYGFIVLLLILLLYMRDSLISQNTLFAVMGVAALIVGVWRLIACCGLPRSHYLRAFSKYVPTDIIVALLIGSAAVTIFLEANTSALHGWWHVLASLALYFGMESVYEDYGIA